MMVMFGERVGDLLDLLDGLDAMTEAKMKGFCTQRGEDQAFGTEAVWVPEGDELVGGVQPV